MHNAVLDFKNYFFNDAAHLRDTLRIIVPNLVEIGRTVVEISQFFTFS